MKRFFTLFVFCSLLIAPNLFADELYGWGSDSAGQIGLRVINPKQISTDFKEIAAGSFHTVGIKTAGTLWTWGNNWNGQLGDGTDINRSIPTQIGSETNWASVSAGESHTTAIKTDGTLWTWGNNWNGQLGDGTDINRSIPTQIGSETNWASVSAGESHTLAIKTDASLWAWGSNSYGKLGDGTNNDNSTPTQIGSETNWASVSAGESHTIAIKTDGTLWTWGNNWNGQLGDGTDINRSIPTQIGSETNWASVASGGSHSLVIKTDGTLWAWGDNWYGQLGDGTTANRLSPILIGNGFSKIAAGYGQTFGIKNDGTLWAWGYNGNGQLGDGWITNRLSPVKISSDFIKIATGGYHTIGIKTDGTLWAWGNNWNGQLGDGTISNKNTPTQIGREKKWASVYAGDFYTFAIKTAGTLWKSGSNFVEQFGDKTNWKSVAAGGGHTLAIKTDSTLFAWGGNQYGQLGDGTKIHQISPINIGISIKWKNISAGHWHTLGIQADGSLWAWGNNEDGQLGDGTDNNRSIPTQIGTETNWASVSAGGSHSLAIKTDGSLWAWGNNNFGQLGDGTYTDNNIPTQIGTETNWSYIAAGGIHTLAINTNSTLWAWGGNTDGQLGDGNNTDNNTPTQIGSDTNWTSVAAGWHHTLAIKTNSTLWAWGYNGYGQLGDGTETNRSIPTQIGSDTNWTSVAAGFIHTIALKFSDTIPTPIITVTSPNGGEKYYSTDKTKIQWTYDALPVKIEFSLDNGSNWENVVTNVIGGYYDWTIPKVKSDSCLIRISDFYDSSIQDVSDNVFSINDTIISSNNVLIIPADGTEVLFPTDASKCYKISVNGVYTMWERDTCFGVDAAYIYNVPKIAFDNFVWTSSLALPLWFGDNFGIILNKYRWNFRSHVGFRIDGEPLPPAGFQELTHQYEIGKIYGTGNYMKFQILDSLIDTTIHKTNPIPKYNDNCGFLTVIIEEIDCGDGSEIEICKTELIYDKAPRDSIAIGIKIKAAVWENDPYNIIGKRNIISELSRDTSRLPYRQLGIAIDDYFVPIDSIVCQNTGILDTIRTIVGSGLVVDISNSMNWEIDSVTDHTIRIVAAKEALTKYIKRMRATDRAFLMSFNDITYLNSDWTSDKPTLINEVNSLDANGWTALYQSIIDGVNKVSSNDANKKALVVLSDGENTEPQNLYELNILKDKLIQIVKQKNIPIYFVALGYDADPFIDTFVSLSGGKTYSVYNADSLNLIYDSISVSINQDDCCSIYITYPCICDEDVNKEHYIKLFYTPSDTVTVFTTIRYKCKYPVYDCWSDVPSEFIGFNKLYPNPANNNATYDFNLDYPYLVKFKIIDAMGNVVKTIEYNSIQSGEQRVNFDLSDLSSGAYLFVALFNEYALTEKFIILK